MASNTQITAYVSDISTLRLSDAEEAGGKGANMGELVAAGLAVPPGFVLMRAATRRRCRRAESTPNSLRCIVRRWRKLNNSARLSGLCERMQNLVTKAGVSDDVRDQLLDSYRRLGPNCAVAVRSSAIGEDGRDASFAG